MTPDEVMQELAALGTEQNRKIYRRHGARDPLFGVSYANLNALRKRIKRDHALATALWATGNHDARVLATMIADPARVDEALVESWVADLRDHGLADAVVALVGRTTLARPLAERWLTATEVWPARVGWHLLGHLARHDASLPDEYFIPRLADIERGIHGAPNRVREAMNNVLIAVGGRNDTLAPLAIAAAGRIGPVTVDHGETDCATPNAIPYIEKMRARARQKTAATA
jgi:3-methyladenine DNA glycosylase AlkD